MTAISAVNALGRTTREALASLDAGRSGLRDADTVGALDLPFRTLVGAVPGELPPLPHEHRRHDTRAARLAALAMRELVPALERARQRWGADRIGVLLGTSTGGMADTERALGRREGPLPDLRTQQDFAATAHLLADLAGLEGPAYAVSTACSSSLKVVASGLRLMDLGVVDAVLVGGVEALCRMTLHGFHDLGILAEGSCRPFAVDRCGLSLGEGAALLLLERPTDSTRADAEALVLGVGESSDAYNMSSPEPSGRGARESMERALGEAGLSADAVDLVLAHGTGTPRNDGVEALAIRTVLGGSVPVVSTKGYTGHQLGAAGASSAVFAIHVLRSGRIPASLGSSPVDPALGISVLHQGAARARVDAVLTTTLAFGGSNVALLLGRSPTLARDLG